MRQRRFFVEGIIAGVTILLLASCAGHKAKHEEPDWVQKGNGAFLDNDQKAFYGVGAVTGVQNKPLAKTAADNRARAEVAKVFETYSASLMRDYAASTTAGDFKKTSEEQNIEQTIKTFSATTLSGVIIIDHWTDPADGTLYSLARLDLDKFKDNIQQARELNAAVRDYVEKMRKKPSRPSTRKKKNVGNLFGPIHFPIRIVSCCNPPLD
ncbi:MAG: LPP20 family lipoprotein [Candidatus Manganitrophus sp.]|nr:MAG: LPP20 family lipoprotein [Candidatus Manganitrophus sp.]